MKRTWLAVVVVWVAVVSAPLSAELRFTTKITARAVPGAPPPSGMLAAMGDVVGQVINEQFGGPDGVETITTVHEDGRMRVESAKSFSGLPAGAVVLTRADGTSVGYDPAAKTWWKMPDPGTDPAVAGMMARMKPELSSKRTGEFVTVTGLRAERVTVRMRIPIPMPEGVDLSQVPPELLAMIPRELVIEGDSWVAAAFGKYMKAGLAALSAGPMAQLGFDTLGKSLDGFPVRSVMRTSVPAAIEIETLVTKVGEEAVPASVFEVPAGLREIPFPGGL